MLDDSQAEITKDITASYRTSHGTARFHGLNRSMLPTPRADLASGNPVAPTS